MNKKDKNSKIKIKSKGFSEFGESYMFGFSDEMHYDGRWDYATGWLEFTFHKEEWLPIELLYSIDTKKPLNL